MSELKFIVDQIEMPETRGMFEKGASKSLDLIVDMTSDTFQEKLAIIVGNITGALSKIETGDSSFEVDEASFSINVSSEGELSVVSMLKAGISGGSGIQVKVKRKSDV